MSFNEKLQMLRKKNNLSQEELANMLDVTRQSVFHSELQARQREFPQQKDIRNNP